MGRRLGPALASFLFALALAGCGDEKSSEGLTGPRPPSETGASPAPLPAQIVALTKQGDVVVIDRETRESRVIASFPPREDPQVEAGSFRAVDVTALPDGRFLVATCCEPAAGHMYALSEDGHRLKDQDIFAEDAGHDADSRVASGELVGLVIRPLSDLNSAAYTLAPPPDVSGFSPDSISWSAADDNIVFTLGDTIGVVEVSADSLADATYVDPPDGSYWAGVASTTEGTVAIEQGGDSLHPSGPSRLVRLDIDTGSSTKLVSIDGRITDLAADPTGNYLLWVEGGDLHWLAADVEATLPGDFVAAGWMSAA
jgi:hypothetical protein